MRLNRNDVLGVLTTTSDIENAADGIIATMCKPRMNINDTETHFLMGYGAFSEIRLGVIAKTFGHIVQTVEGVLAGFYSDLFHDAQWVDRNFDLDSGGQGVFFLTFDRNGTWLTRENDEVAAAREFLYRFDLRSAGGAFYLDVTRIR